MSVNFYKYKTLLQNLFLIIILALAPVIFLSAYYSSYWSNYIKEEEFEKDTRFLSLARQAFDTVINDITQVTSLLEFDQLLNSALEGLVESDGRFSASKLTYLNSVWENTSRLLMSKPYIRSAYFYVEESQNLVFTIEGIRNLNAISDTDWLESYRNQSKEIAYWSESRKVRYSSQPNDTIQTISFFRKIPYFTGAEPSKGVIVVNLESKYFDSLISNIPNIQDKKLFVLDDKFSVIYSNSKELYTTYVSQENISGQKMERNMVKRIGRDEYLVSIVQSPNYGWKYISVIPIKTLLHKLDFMVLISIGICLLSLLASILLSLFYTLKNYRPVKTMVNILTHFDQGKDISNFKFPKNDEYGYIIFNLVKNLIDKNEMQKNLTEEKLLQKETQLYALQSQINPHFLYNTLENLNWEAINMLGKDNPISKILLKLAGNLRYVTNYSNSLVPLEEEITQLKSYVYMLEILNSDRIQFIFRQDESIRSSKTLKLLIQPLVENAVIHGLANREKGGKVWVSSKNHNGTLLIKVIDNGCGIQKARLLEIKAGLEMSNLFDSKSLGIKNINYRIKLKFGETYGVSIRSKAGLGTAVYVRLPLL